MSLDHLVYAVPDLEEGVAAFAGRTGVLPMKGGSHPGGTTPRRSGRCRSSSTGA
ncbi:VOC family protein [Nonomuraea dietziae]|uniref:VOC family protein n=1 Tax=Nonomuraea dietziae TaxID=65515 RepID=UPI0034021CD4